MSTQISYAEPVALAADAQVSVQRNWHHALMGPPSEAMTFGQLAERLELEPNSDLRFAIAFRQRGYMLVVAGDDILMVYPR